MKRRSRPRSNGSAFRRVVFALLFVTTIAISGAAVVPSISFSTIDGARDVQLGIGDDENGLLGIELADSVPVGTTSGPFDCSVSGDTVVVTSRRAGGIDTEHGVVIESGASVDGPITAGGCVVVESGGRAFDDVTAGGDVTIDSGAQIEGDIEAGGSLIVYSGGRALRSVDVAGSVTLVSGAQIDGNADIGGDTTMHSGSRILGNLDAGGSVTLASGSQIDGDVEVGEPGLLTLEPGARILGDVDDTSGSDADSAVFLVEVTNNVNRGMWVTVTLSDSDDGLLFADGDSGSTVGRWLGPGASTVVDVVPSSEGGNEIEFEILASTTDGDTVVSLTRSVEKV